MNETMQAMIERIIHEGNAKMKTVAQIAEDIAEGVDEWNNDPDNRMGAACNGPCCS